MGAWQLEDYPQVSEVIDELHQAEKKFPAFHSAHEGYAVLLEEVDELWDIVKLNPQERSTEDTRRMLRAEAIQVAAMALRFIRDVCDK